MYGILYNKRFRTLSSEFAVTFTVTQSELYHETGIWLACFNWLKIYYNIKYISSFRTGFEEERIDAILHRIQLSQKHQSSNFGLSLIAVSSLNG